jgi:hypothetical protein
MTTSIFIDKLTNSIEDAVTGESLETEIVSLEKADLKNIPKKYGWRFSWKKETKYSDRRVCKLVVRGDSIIQGLISLQVMDGFVEMHLIESSPHNIGHKKKYAGVAGNLVAFACKMSFDLGFQGFIAFTPKTILVQHYTETLGAELIFRNRMKIASVPAKKLVNSYYDGYFKA